MRWLILSLFTCVTGMVAPMPRVEPRFAARVAMFVIGLAWRGKSGSSSSGRRSTTSIPPCGNPNLPGDPEHHSATA